MDCFASLAKTIKRNFAISPRDAREFAANVPPSEDQRAQGYPKRGAGNAGRPMRPQPRV